MAGDLVIYAHPHLRSVVSGPEICTRPLLALDLTGVEFLDSSGVSLIVSARRRTASRGAQLALMCPAGHIRKLLRTSWLDRVMTVTATVAELTDDGRTTVARRLTDG